MIIKILLSFLPIKANLYRQKFLDIHVRKLLNWVYLELKSNVSVTFRNTVTALITEYKQ